MTVKELKKRKDYLFKCYISKRTLTSPVRKGEYNLCIDNTTNESINSSAIYKVRFYEEKGKCFSEIDTENYIEYEIDFNNRRWKKELEYAMCEAVIEFFKL